MKIYYYVFTPAGEVKQDVILARKNKYFYVVGAGETYGGIEHLCTAKLSIRHENKVINSDSTATNGCYLFSSTVKEITEEMKAFAVERAGKIQKIIKTQEEIREIEKNFNIQMIKAAGHRIAKAAEQGIQDEVIEDKERKGKL